LEKGGVIVSKEFLSLANICEGKLESEFQEAYTAIMGQLRSGKTGTINISIKLKRMDNTATMTEIGYSLNAKLPPQKRACIGEIVDGGRLKVEPVPENVAQLKLIKEEK
jgi:hypothetical protein